MSFEVFAEIACPFTHLALRRIVEGRGARGRTDIPLRIRPWPLELVNGQPLDAHHVAKEVRALRAQVSADLFTGFDVDAFPTTSMPALRLVEAAYVAGDDVGERVSLAVRDALFERGRDVGDPSVLAEVAAAHGITVPGDALDDVVRRAYADGVARGVVGSPHFFVGGTSAFCPLLDIRRDDQGEFQVAFDAVAAAALLDAWFPPAS
ncbi:MAG: DsbA family protein [Acidimicrobiales bacterium]